jgi:CHAT domain-containing protein
LDLAFLQSLKDTYAVTAYILAEPVTAERATRYGLIIAEQMGDEALALPLARWARGLWAMFHAPEEAVTLFQQAQLVYRAVGDTLSVARLNANLVGVLTECGRFAEAEIAYQAARPEFSRYLDGNPLYLVRLEQNYGWLLHSAGRFSEALVVHDRALDLARQYQLVTSIAEVHVNRNLTLGMVGRLTEVEINFLQERIAAAEHKQLVTVARIDMNLGDLYTWQGRVAAALQRFQMAEQTFTSLDNEMEVASVLFRQAALLSRIGARRAAIRHYAQALPRFTQRQMLPQVGELLVGYALARRQEGEYRQALALLKQAEEVWETLQNPLWQALVVLERMALAIEQEEYGTADQLRQQMPLPTNSLRLQAEFQLLQADLWRLTVQNEGDLNRATQAYETAYAYATTHGERWIERRARVGLGKRWLTDDPVRAVTFFEEAATIDAAIRQTLTVEELKASFHEQANDLFDGLIRLAIANQQEQQALAYSWRAKAGALLDLLYALHEQSTLPATSQAAIEQTRQQIATLRWQQAISADPALPQALQNQHTAQIAALEQQLLDLRRRRNDTYKTTTISSSLTEQCDPGLILPRMEADLLLEYVRCGDELWGIVADRHGVCKGVCLGDVEAIVDLNARLQLRFGNVVAQPAERRRQWNQRWLGECLPLLAHCYEQLVTPLFTQLATATTSILIAPCDPLFLFPFAAFWDGHRFWGERTRIELIPSGALLGVTPPRSPNHSPPLIIAAATGAMTAVRAEAKAVAEALPTSITLIDSPALGYLRSLSAPPKIVHIAAHTLQRADAPLFTALQLAGEVLTVEQGYELPLTGTELVTLSGCTTASGQESESALLAFQSAFLLAGAQRVLTTLWPIADDAATTWMTFFYRALADGLLVPQAIQQTQQQCLADPALCHPALWAPFTSTRR